MTYGSSHCVICGSNSVLGLVFFLLFVEHVLDYGFSLEYTEKLVKRKHKMNCLDKSCFSEFRHTLTEFDVPALLFPADGKKGRKSLIHQIKLEMTFDIFLATKQLLSFQAPMWQTDGCEAMLWRISDLGTHVQPRLRSLVLPPQQAIEDLQSEEEKVNLLTKEKTKLQIQAEDVS